MLGLTKGLTFLDYDQVQNAEIGINDATADRLALALASPAGTVAGVALAEQQAHTAVGQNTLLHGEALLVVASADAHHITLQTKVQDDYREISTARSLVYEQTGNCRDFVPSLNYSHTPRCN